METTRGHLLLQLCTQVARFLKPDALGYSFSQIKVLVNQAQTFRTPKALQKSFSSTIDLLKKKIEASQLKPEDLSEEQKSLMKSLSGAQYPAKDEYELVMLLAEHFVKNYKVVDPMNDIDKKHKA
jgi:hypothetical protein